MKINKKCNGTVNPKTGKKYSTPFKRRIVQHYLLGLYDEQTIWEKFQINRSLLKKWHRWYYDQFEKQRYRTPNYGKGKITESSNQSLREGISRVQRGAEKSRNENERHGNSASTGASNKRREFKKKHWQEGVEILKKSYPQSSMQEVCAVYDKSRQAWYKAQEQGIQEEYREDLIEEEVKRIRKHLPRLGGRKLFHMLESFFKKEGIKIGRDKFFTLLRDRNLLIKKKKYTKKTTNSNHSFKRYPNLIKGLSVTQANQLWVSEITYVSIGRQFCYLNLITDAYSRKIVGWYLSKDLKAENTLKALKMALASLTKKERTTLSLIHHSDRGIQYCSRLYVELLSKNGVTVSMTENGDPYENILAERMNKTIKEEFLDMLPYTNYKEAQAIVSKAIRVYNGYRPHSSLDYLTPNEAHLRKGELRKRWKKYPPRGTKICQMNKNFSQKKSA